MTSRDPQSGPQRTIAIVTGSRAEFGLLTPIIHAVQESPYLALQLIVTGTHLVPGYESIRDIQRNFKITLRVPMQDALDGSRMADARAVARGMTGFAEHFASTHTNIVLVLGDRIEAFAAAATAAIAGIHVAHLHGGDRAPGVADESLRGAITKFAHIHFPATEQSALRLIAMGEDERTVHIVGSPAMDNLDACPSLDDAAFAKLGSPVIVFLLHPVGDPDELEHQRAATLLDLCRAAAPTLAMHPNHDAGRNGIMHAVEASGLPHLTHLPRNLFIGLLRRAKLIIGNSSAALIEAAALGTRAINLGSRQAGRETAAHVRHIPQNDPVTIAKAIDEALKLPRFAGPHPFGNGRTGPRVAELLASLDLQAHPLQKRNTY